MTRLGSEVKGELLSSGDRRKRQFYSGQGFPNFNLLMTHLGRPVNNQTPDSVG